MAVPKEEHDEKALVEAAARNWARHWETVVRNSKPSSRVSWRQKLGRLLRRSGGLELACRIIQKEAGNLPGKLILEAGCGTGEISMRLAQEGGGLVLLDTSSSAVGYAKIRAENLGFAASAVKASIFDFPFKDGVFDFAFNVGVLDHFGPQYRGKAAQEMVRVLKADSRAVILTNDLRSKIHPIAVKCATKKGIWPFGFKDAIFSLRDSLEKESKAHIACEYSRGFLSQFEFLRYCLPQNGLIQCLFLHLFYLLTFPFNLLNRLPGQYLVTVIHKNHTKDDQITPRE